MTDKSDDNERKESETTSPEVGSNDEQPAEAEQKELSTSSSASPVDTEIPLNSTDHDQTDSPPPAKNRLQVPEHEVVEVKAVPAESANGVKPKFGSDEEKKYPCEEDELPEDKTGPPAPASVGKLDQRGQWKKTGWMRHYVAVMALIGVVLANMNRQAFNQALVNMTRRQIRKPIAEQMTTNFTTQAPSLEERLNLAAESYTSQLPIEELTTPPEVVRIITATSATDQADEDHFDWNSQQIGVLQSAFSYGYIPFMIFSARMSELYGAKWVIFLSSFGSATCCIFSPFVAGSYYGYELLVMSRVIMGLCQTGVSPALFALCVRWLPPSESGVYLSLMKVGCTLGFTFGSVVAGFFDWRNTFYIVGGIGFVWSLIWPLTVESDPSESKLIKRDEREFIQQEIRTLTKDRKQSSATERNKSAPWFHIILNPVVLAYMLTKLSVKMSTDAQTQQLSMYLANIFELSEKKNGLLNGVNYAIQAIFTGFVGYAAQSFIRNKTFGLSKTGVRKLFQGICNFGMGISFILITFNMGSIEIVCGAYFLLSVSAMFSASGESVLPIDLTTDYAATIMSLANFTANLSGIILPKLVATILGDDRANNDSWNKIWWIMGGIMIVGGVLFSAFVRAELLNFEENRLIDFLNKTFKRNKSSEKDEKIKQTDSVTIQMKELNQVSQDQPINDESFTTKN